MTPDEHMREEQRRFTILLGVRAIGVVLMLGGLGIWLGHYLGEAGQTIGPALFVLGAADSFLVPAILAKRWRTPRP